MNHLPSSGAAITKAELSDAPGITQLLLGMAEETALYAPHLPTITEHIEDCIRNHLVLITVLDGAIIGSIAIVSGRHWYTRTDHLRDNWLYVAPEHRRTPHASALLNAARIFAEAVGMPLEVGFMCRPGRQNRFKAKSRLFARNFGEPVGLAFFVPGRDAASPRVEAEPARRAEKAA